MSRLNLKGRAARHYEAFHLSHSYNFFPLFKGWAFESELEYIDTIYHVIYIASIIC